METTFTSFGTFGDTVLVSVDQTDSANAQISTARRSFYTVL
jgi:hypothetical protein